MCYGAERGKGEISNINKGLCFGCSEMALLSLPHSLNPTNIAFIQLHFDVIPLASGET